MESAERERDQTKSALSQKQAELTRQQETANAVQQQQQPVESEVQQEMGFHFEICPLRFLKIPRVLKRTHKECTK